MPSKLMALEWLKSEVAKGRGEDKCHIVDVTAEQAERVKNNKQKTRFVLCTEDPDMYRRFESAKDRIFKRVKNKSIALDLMHRAWHDALSDGEIDRIMAEMDGPES
jgi:hypothetical protein